MTKRETKVQKHKDKREKERNEGTETRGQREKERNEGKETQG